ncbi:centrosomal protein of 295 kDa [Cheilinus undulatus]|uniref:centrosomal protein of 295 kDa n=1 Tax=Cheilinus undulatus TaxID=241271 RepID=UPI001BD52456|nr:centrosomal protein of 295 kDa [Cheilinus undulatus]
MERKVAILRPSPNEEARIIREEHERRRKLRIQQVREQQRYIALQIRQEVERRRQRELEKLGEELRADWERQQREKLDTLQKLYQESLLLIGQGHRDAKENEPDLVAVAQREEENHTKAVQRHREALKELKSQRLKDKKKQNRVINARKKALLAEKERAAKVASLPPPPPNPIQNIDSKKPHVVKKSDVSAFAATHYHMPESTVDREEETKQPNACEEAELEVRRLQDLQREEQRRREEQLEKARLRGKQALKREHLVQDRQRLLVELEHMQQTDLLRRRQQVAQMPPQIFQPLYKRKETREDFQREMEFAFEDMYTGERRVKGDLVVQLVPEPLPAPSTGSQDQELDITLDEIATPGTENTQQEDGRTEQGTSPQGVPPKPAPRRALKKLLDRIRNQRTHWVTQNSRVLAADSPPVSTDHIPERDATIDTGSLTSEEKGILPPTELPEPDGSASALAAVESVAAEGWLPAALHPDGLLNRIQEFEEERKKREEELEREKQQQVMLIQELEEQKAKLEQMLLEAQQEREQLKAAVTQQVPTDPPEVPVQDSVSPGVAFELVPAPAEDGHSSRIREYQQRLLEQNRTHQRTVEVARQRLEEYQRALRIRYNMSAASSLPAVAPPSLIHPPLSAPSVRLPTPLQLPTTPVVSTQVHNKPPTPVEVPTRETDSLSSLSCFTGSNLRVGSQLLSNTEELMSELPSNQRPDVTALLTDSIMERVTRHLAERERPFSVTVEPLSYKTPSTHKPTIAPHHPPSDTFQTTSQHITDNAPRQIVYHEDIKPAEPLQAESINVKADSMERQRQELQVVQRRFLEQSELLAQQQRQQEEERRRQELEREQMKRHKEKLQVLIHTDPDPATEADSEVSVSDNISQTRLKILASLLRVIEETSGGSLSHLEEDPQEDDSAQQLQSDSEVSEPVSLSDIPAEPSTASVLPQALLPPLQATKPPVTRVRLGIMDMMMEQHELSAIQEVETPVNTSLVTGPEESLRVPLGSADFDPQEESASSFASDRSLHTPSVISRGEQTAERPNGSGASSRRSSLQAWRKRLMEAGRSSPESSESDSVLRMISPVSSDSGRGADYSGPAVMTFRSPSETAHRPPDSDCLSSTTISTGSYITTDPEQNVNSDKSSPLKHFLERSQGADLLGVSSPSLRSVCDKDSSAAHPGPAVDSLFSESNIQRIIDRYTQELNFSLNTTGRVTDREGSFTEEPGPSVSQQSLVCVSERSEGDERTTYQSPPSDTAGEQGSGWERNNPILEQSSREDPSLAEDSFRPLIGHLTDQSSCLTAEHRDPTMEQLVGQPSAHSSMIGQPPGPLVSLSLDQGGWDSTLMRMIGRLSHPSSSHWLSGGQDFYAGHLIGEMSSERSTTWLDEGQEETLMRPLVGELDESAGQNSGSSGERRYTEASVPSYPALPPETSSHNDTVPGLVLNSQEQVHQDQTNPTDQGQERTEVFPGSDSFHPLLAEVTHNETAYPSVIFHQPELDVPISPEQQASEGHSISTPSEELERPDDPTVESEPSPERLRAEEPSSCTTASPALHESFSQLMTSKLHPHESVLTESPIKRTNVELTALNLLQLNLCDSSAKVEMPEEAKTNKNSISVQCSKEEESGQGSTMKNDTPVSCMIMEAACEKGILEQSEITLVSLTDTTLQDQETTITEEDDEEEEVLWEDRNLDRMREEGKKGQKTKRSESLLLNETPEDQKHSGTLLEFQWGPSESLQEAYQQKCRALLQRSSRRVEEIKTKAALAKNQPKIQEPSKTRDKSSTKDSNPVICKAKTKSESQHKNKTSSRGGPAELQRTTETAGFSNQKKTQGPPLASDVRLEEVKLCTTGQRKRDVSEMHQRTQRLYEQLEEVKHQKAMRSRQEAYAQNRLKAKEFHKKTLQKLRAKQTLQ